MNNVIFNFLTLMVILIFLSTIVLIMIFIIKLITHSLHKNKDLSFKILVVIIIGIIIISIYYYNYNHNLEFLPKGYLNEIVISPNGQREIRTYNFSGFIYYKNLRAEVIDIKTNKSKTIYYNTEKGKINVKWINNNIIAIGDIILNVDEDIYDYRNNKNP